MNTTTISIEASEFKKYDLCRVYVDGIRHELFLSDTIVIDKGGKGIIGLTLDFKVPEQRKGIDDYTAKELLKALKKKI